MSDKFKAMVHLIVHTCHDPHRLGGTRLNKICWFVDTSAYRSFAKPVTPERYVKRKMGPVPASILMVLQELEQEKKIVIEEAKHQVYKTRLFSAITPPDLSLFSAQDIEIIRETTEAICRDHTANSISDVTHDEIWSAAAEGEEMPMFAALVAEPGEITSEICLWADSVLELVHGNQSGEQNRVAIK